MNKVNKTDKDPCITEYSYDVPPNAVKKHERGLVTEKAVAKNSHYFWHCNCPYGNAQQLPLKISVRLKIFKNQLHFHAYIPNN